MFTAMARPRGCSVSGVGCEGGALVGGVLVGGGLVGGGVMDGCPAAQYWRRHFEALGRSATEKEFIKLEL